MEVNASKESLKSLFNALGIKRVICVDDEYVALPADEIYGLCVEIGADACAKITELAVDFSRSPNIWRANFNRFWQNANEKVKVQISNSLQTSSGKEFTSISPLTDLLDFCDFQVKTPAEWHAEKDQLLIDAATIPTLFLFDRDLSNAKEGDDGGIALLRDAIKNEDAICGMLSHHFTLENEQQTWQDFVKEGIPGDRFILISKQHVQEDKQLGFVRMVKLMILNGPSKELTNLLADRMREGINAASESVSAINVYDLEHIIFRKSSLEGIWEADTLFRILSLYQKKELRKKSEQHTAIHEHVSKIRKVLNVKTHEDYSFSTETSWAIQRLEWYEDADDLNSHFLPISLGDIFEKNGQPYVLLCQPCDLMVRSDGKRNFQLSDVFLAEITKKPNDSHTYMKAKYFSETKSEPHFVSFKCRLAVSLDVLDLCALHSQGNAIYKKGSVQNDLLIPAWAARAKILSDIYNKVIEKLLVPKGQNKEQWLEKMPRATRDGKFAKPTFTSNDTISYPLKRVGRICSPFSDEILSEFCSYLARPAHSMELVKDEYEPVIDDDC